MHLQRTHEQEGYPVRAHAVAAWWLASKDELGGWVAVTACDRVALLQVDPDSAARSFYRRRGWREVGTVTQHWGPRPVDAVLMVPADRGRRQDDV